MSDKKTEVSEIVKDMAKFTILSNRISDIQEKNLKMYPFVFFEGVKSVKIDYDLSRTKPSGDIHERCYSSVSYFLTIDEKVNEPNLQQRFTAIEASVRKLFWSDVSVEIWFNNTIKYKSKNYARE